jgi:hypothetical protein
LKPYTHLSIAYLVAEALEAAGGKVDRRGMFVGSVLPDVDFVLLPFIPRILSHRTAVHSLSWITLAAAWLRHRFGFGSVWLGGLTHLVADELNSCDRRHGHWPRQMWLFPFDIGRPPWRRCLLDMGAVPGPQWLRVFLTEAPIVLAALWLARRRKGQEI